eukprot:TRINITY_DN4992_c0_g1_i1.p1 TRINITY_DN4992_c0_g1~~TRINITY_DN4992_c0_g1_i1.p1  ORF type:complete len:130 (-),score=41.95 TRINITY_DN4992_c0_g1_i1:86-475(-)
MAMLVALGVVKNGFTTEEAPTNAVQLEQGDVENNEVRMEKLLILSPAIAILYFIVLLGIVLFSIFTSYRKNLRRLVMEERQNIVIEMKKLDRPPSYTRIYFSDDPPQYRDIVIGSKHEDDDDDVPLITL